jgi:hypothetical protein
MTYWRCSVVAPRAIYVPGPSRLQLVRVEVLLREAPRHPAHSTLTLRPRPRWVFAA